MHTMKQIEAEKLYVVCSRFDCKCSIRGCSREDLGYRMSYQCLVTFSYHKTYEKSALQSYVLLVNLEHSYIILEKTVINSASSKLNLFREISSMVTKLGYELG